MTKAQKLTESEKAFNSDVRALALSFKKSDGQNAERSRLAYRATEHGFTVRAIAQKVAEARVRLDHPGEKLTQEFVEKESKLDGYKTSSQTIQFLVTAYRYVVESGVSVEDDSALAKAYTLANRGGDVEKGSDKLTRKGELISLLKVEVASLPEPDRAARFIEGTREILRKLASKPEAPTAPVSESQEVEPAGDAPKQEKVSPPTGADRMPMGDILNVVNYASVNVDKYSDEELFALYEAMSTTAALIQATADKRHPAKV